MTTKIDYSQPSSTWLSRLGAMQVPVVADNASPSDLEPEPEGFWDAVHGQVSAWVSQYGDESDDAE